VPPTGNRVLNQIPAGDGRESSREQVVLDDGALFLLHCPFWGPGDHFPLLASSWTQWQSDFPDPPKKKKKKKEWREVEAGAMCKWNLHRGSEVEAMQMQWYRSGSKEELVECAGQRWVYTIGISPAACRNDTNIRRHNIQAVITGKESIIQSTSHGKRGKGSEGSEDGWERDRRDRGERRLSE